MKTSELRSKSEDQLKSMINDLRKESFNLRFQKSGGSLENTTRIREVRRTLARIKTLLNENVKGISKPVEKAEKTEKKAKKKETKKTKKKAA